MMKVSFAVTEKGKILMSKCTENGSDCRYCFHSYVCEKFNEHKDDNNKKCHFANDHYVSTDDVDEVRHGHWKYNPNGMDWGIGAWECSLCRCRNDNLPMDEKINPRIWAGSKFCPNCGAKMDGERKEQKENV